MSQRVLVTGATGQIGSELVPALRERYGRDNVIALVHSSSPSEELKAGILERGDATDKAFLASLIDKYEITVVFHLVGVLSAKGEQDPQLAWRVNMGSLKHVLDLAVEKKFRLFWPSSIAVFGPTTPRDRTPQRTILEPSTMYGVTKLAGEALCSYYHRKYGVDVRSLRYPGIISYKTPPGGGTTDYAVDIFYKALQQGRYECFLKEDATLPMLSMDDAVRATLQLMDAPAEKLTVRTSYNLAAISFSPAQLAAEIKKRVPALVVTYRPDHRQAIAESWPRVIDDSVARKDWGWKHEHDLPKLVAYMLDGLNEKFKKE